MSCVYELQREDSGSAADSDMSLAIWKCSYHLQNKNILLCMSSAVEAYP